MTWNGLILVVGQGVVHTKPGATAIVNGGLFVARTYASDGTLLSTPIDVAYTVTDIAQIKTANARFPYSAIAIKEK